MEDGIMTAVNEEQLAKAPLAIDFVLAGSVIDVNEALSPIDLMEPEICIDLKEVHHRKALLPIRFTEEGMVKVVKEEQP
eukprot:1342079-Ditylum_brightwellii.AAC.1